jgi:hypothetical protein
MTQKNRKHLISPSFEVLDVLFGGLKEGSSCSLDILYERLGISKLHFLIQKKI